MGALGLTGVSATSVTTAAPALRDDFVFVRLKELVLVEREEDDEA